jgi:hypothetical protein
MRRIGRSRISMIDLAGWLGSLGRLGVIFSQFSTSAAKGG